MKVFEAVTEISLQPEESKSRELLYKVAEQIQPKTKWRPPVVYREAAMLKNNLLFYVSGNPDTYYQSVLGTPYSRFMASVEMTHCLPYLQASTPLISFP